MKEEISRQQRTRQPLVLLETVDDLFPENKITLTEEQIQFYRRAGAYAFAIDRQSLEDTYKDLAKTGPEARLRAILGAAEWLKLHLPEPPENPGWKVGDALVSGVPQFDYRHPSVEPFWFADGTERNASGYIVNQRTRPELWRAYHLAIRLGEAGCPPTAYIVGEPTRFFRAAKWINLFAEGLWGKGIKLYVVPFGEITPHTIGAYVQYVQALSGRIQEYRKQAWEAYKRRGRVFHKKLAFGVMVEEDGARVVADPDAWPHLYGLCEAIADGTADRLWKAIQWLQAHGVEKSMSWLRQLLREEGGILDGYYRCYRWQHLICEREDPSGLLRDPAVTESGYRRYQQVKGLGVAFPIEHLYGTHPIPPELVEAARAQIIGQRGRPERPDSRHAKQRAERLVPMRKVRCAHCGSGIQETNPSASNENWFLRCHCVNRLVQNLKLSYEEARKHPLTQHTMRASGSISGPVWELLVAELRQQPVPPKQDTPDTIRERQRWLEAKRTAEADLENVTTNFLLLRAPGPEVARLVEVKQAELQGLIAQCQQQIEVLAADTLQATQRAATLAHYQRDLGEFLDRPDLPIEKKREIIEAMVEQVVVNLDTGEFEVKIRTPRGVVRQGLTTNHTSTGGCADIVLRGAVFFPPHCRAA